MHTNVYMFYNYNTIYVYFYCIIFTSIFTSIFTNTFTNAFTNTLGLQRKRQSPAVVAVCSKGVRKGVCKGVRKGVREDVRKGGRGSYDGYRYVLHIHIY